ncbi:MAG: hypothetical protein JRH20_01170 [Deltaproteobacteria bacterium]|nr:hypothetical protein [Deltaproteobacteria bacterium]
MKAHFTLILSLSLGLLGCNPQGAVTKQTHSQERILDDPVKLLNPADIDSPNVIQYSSHHVFDSGLISAKTLHASGYRMEHLRLLYDQPSNRVFMTSHTALNRPYDNGVRNSPDCPEGLRTVILNEVDGDHPSNFNYSALVAADCGYRVANADMHIHDRRMFIVYIVVGGADVCRYDDPSVNTAIPVEPGTGGKKWQVRLKVSSVIDQAPITFSGVAPGKDFEVLAEVCVPNYVSGGGDGVGSAEPFITKIDDNIIHVVYADEYLAPANSCGQVIRGLKYSMVSHTVVSDEEVGRCPGDRVRDGMPVVAYHEPSKKYFMVFESLRGGERDEIVLMDSPDGEVWSNRRQLIQASSLGAGAVGVPYIKSYRQYLLVSFVSVHEAEKRSKVRLLILDSDGKRIDFGGETPDAFTLMDEEYSLEGEANLFWGAIEVIGDKLYATGNVDAANGDDTRVTEVSIAALPTATRLAWDGYNDRRRCAMDIWLGDTRVGCTYSGTIGERKTYLFDGYCTRQGRNYDISKITKFGLSCALNGDFSDAENIVHAERAYNGADFNVHMQFEVPPAFVDLSWDGYNDRRRCAMSIWLGETRVGCTYSSSIGDAQSYRFDGYCTRQSKTYKISEITKFGLSCALDGDFSDADNIISAQTSYDGTDSRVSLSF